MRSAYNENSLLYLIMLASTNIAAGQYIAHLFKVDFKGVKIEDEYEYHYRLKEAYKYL